MTNSERAAAAAELKATGQCNCTQAVLKVFEDRLPATPPVWDVWRAPAEL